MNEQKPPRGIGWTLLRLRDGRVLRGYTCNPIRGCLHRCRWIMADGSEAICYAEDVAEGLASAAYPEGFAHHYWHPEVLREPLALKEPAGIFLGSMSDIMGHWVPDEQIAQVLEMTQQASWHTFFLLTKNPKRLLQWRDQIPENVWVGASAPPSFMWGKKLDERLQVRMLDLALETLAQLDNVCWMSFEPLSFDVSPTVWTYARLNWAVIGAASNGRTTYQPNPDHVRSLLDVLDEQRVPVFFKENLVWTPRREEFPVWPPDPPQRQLRLF